MVSPISSSELPAKIYSLNNIGGADAVCEPCSWHCGVNKDKTGPSTRICDLSSFCVMAQLISQSNLTNQEIVWTHLLFRNRKKHPEEMEVVPSGE